MRERPSVAPGSRRTTAPRKTNSKCVQSLPRVSLTKAVDIERRPLPALLLPEIGREYIDLAPTQPPLYWGGAVNQGLTRSLGHPGLPITQRVNHVSGIIC